MSDEGEKTCPLCAEEMDLTDQQLKPCKCGYEICVWCWHHIMDMAEKDETEGRCPACRNSYNKEKIVGTTANCDRLASGLNVEKKLRLQKGKSKTSEGRKQLGSVRVIQRNLVYVVGLPLNFADEDLLQRREYFGQYGKVLKVSISRTAAGAIQHCANSTCSVYITYLKEEEAVRCIQSVHGFVFDGKPLRACFGTTKYCHAWLRNTPCTNPDCLYLHETGSQEDSFTKDEIISAYTRVQNITGVSNSLQRRSGNVLPPPADEYCNNSSASSGKPIIKASITANSSATAARISPPNSSGGRSAALPAGASWGARPSNNQVLPTSTPCSTGAIKQKPDSCNTSVAFSSAVGRLVRDSSLPSDTEKLDLNEEITTNHDNTKEGTGEPIIDKLYANQNISILDSSSASLQPVNSTINKLPDSSPPSKPLSNATNVIDSSARSSRHRESTDSTNGAMENVCSDILTMSIHEKHQLQYELSEQGREPLTCQRHSKTGNKGEEITGFQSDFRLGTPIQTIPDDLLEIEDDLLSFDRQRMKDPEVADSRIQNFSHAFPQSKHSIILSSPFNMADSLICAGMDGLMDKNDSSMVPTSDFPSWHSEHILNNPDGNNFGKSDVFPRSNKRLFPRRYEGETNGSVVEMGESSIISNILSMEFESLDEPLTSPQNFAKLLGETDKRHGPIGTPVSRKNQSSNQSRFSFAREEESVGQTSHYGQCFEYFDQALKQQPFGRDLSFSSSLHLEKVVPRNGFSSSKSSDSDTFLSSHSHASANKISVCRSQISAPPGFSVPSRPPPGFTSFERTDQILDVLSGNDIPDAAILRNQYLTPSSGITTGNGDIEFMDPAILAVGKGTLSGTLNGPGLDIRANFSPQLSTYENTRFQSFLQRSLPTNQNQRFTDIGDSFSARGDVHGILSRVTEQNLVHNLSPFSQFNNPPSRNGITSGGQWESWNGVQGGNSLGLSELFRTERLGFNKLYGAYEDSKFQMPSSGNLYDRTYGI